MRGKKSKFAANDGKIWHHEKGDVTVLGTCGIPFLLRIRIETLAKLFPMGVDDLRHEHFSPDIRMKTVDAQFGI